MVRIDLLNIPAVCLQFQIFILGSEAEFFRFIPGSSESTVMYFIN